MILTTSADASLPAFVRSCLLFAERAQAEATRHAIVGAHHVAIALRHEAAMFRSVAGRFLRAQQLFGVAA
jgi:hypothetical protein